jgi:carbonic anhydrase/acetyltransferase-like protein (isoleucine patch superfamily)
MAFGQLVADLLYFLGFLALLSLSCACGLSVHAALGASLPPVLALAVSILAGLLAWVFAVVVLHLPMSSMKAGRFPMMKSAGFYRWFFSYLLRRYLAFPPVLPFMLQSHVLRFVALRLLGARVHFTTQMSGDVLVLDPALFEAGPKSLLGSGVLVAGHLVAEGRLILSPVRLGARVEVGARSGVSPGVTVGDDTRIGLMVNIGPEVKIGRGCVLEHHVTLDAHCTVGDGARILACTYVPPGTDIPANAVWSTESDA